VNRDREGRSRNLPSGLAPKSLTVGSDPVGWNPQRTLRGEALLGGSLGVRPEVVPPRRIRPGKHPVSQSWGGPPRRSRPGKGPVSSPEVQAWLERPPWG
jgi:hypothetical protein